jgi:hypothetical protein
MDRLKRGALSLWPLGRIAVWVKVPASPSPLTSGCCHFSSHWTKIDSLAAPTLPTRSKTLINQGCRLQHPSSPSSCQLCARLVAQCLWPAETWNSSRQLKDIRIRNNLSTSASTPVRYTCTVPDCRANKMGQRSCQTMKRALKYLRGGGNGSVTKPPSQQICRGVWVAGSERLGRVCCQRIGHLDHPSQSLSLSLVVWSPRLLGSSCKEVVDGPLARWAERR